MKGSEATKYFKKIDIYLRKPHALANTAISGSNPEGKPLLPAGSTVDEDAIRALIAAGGPDCSMKTYILMDHGSISHDLKASSQCPAP
ncbi:MAG: hypothetical protein R2860_14855 [Desulfobacterales bacterium]